MSVPVPVPGDWVRFYRDGILVVGVVQYVTYDEIRLRYEISTDIGQTDAQYILEVRSPRETDSSLSATWTVPASGTGTAS